MEQVLIQNARCYASMHQLRLAERLGFGIHGIVPVAEDNSHVGETIQAHRSVDVYPRERRVSG
jgi:hypothetical protein